MGIKIIWFGVSERGLKRVKDDITWMGGGGLVVNGWQICGFTAYANWKAGYIIHNKPKNSSNEPKIVRMSSKN